MDIQNDSTTSGKSKQLEKNVNTVRWESGNVTTKPLKYKKRLLLRCIHHFILDLINNMDHMRISGTEPSSVILSQTVVQNVE